MSLARQFAALALVLSLISTIAIGSWVAREIERGILSRSSGTAAIFISDLLAPMMRDLATDDELGPLSVDRLEALMETAALRLRIEALKVWGADGQVLFSSDPNMIGDRFEPEAHRMHALQGQIASHIDRPARRGVAEYSDDEPFFEVYAPIYDHLTGKVIAVVGLYENADAIRSVIFSAKLESWLVTALVLILNTLAFFAVVHGGSRTIERQRVELTQRIEEISRAMAREKALSEQVVLGAKRASRENERFLHSIGSDLHDGPAQLIGLALLRLGERHAADPAIVQAREALDQAMQELRGIAAGLLLPDLEGQRLEECVRATVRHHEAKTGTLVDLVCEELPDVCPQDVKVCICRFIQEGLSNAFRHAGGVGQSVAVRSEKAVIKVTVADRGPGMPASARSDQAPRLGLTSLRGRLASVNGTLTVSSKPRRGTVLVATLPFGTEKRDAG